MNGLVLVGIGLSTLNATVCLVIGATQPNIAGVLLLHTLLFWWSWGHFARSQYYRERADWHRDVGYNALLKIERAIVEYNAELGRRPPSWSK